MGILLFWAAWRRVAHDDGWWNMGCATPLAVVMRWWLPAGRAGFGLRALDGPAGNKVEVARRLFGGLR